MSTAYQHRRWSDNDKHFGPFLYSRDKESKRFGLIAVSGGDGEEDAGAHLRLHMFGHTVICDLPPIIKPWREWIDMTKYDWHKGPSDGYWDVHSKSYGVMYSFDGSGFLQVFLGAQTGDSSTTKSWSKFLPWTQWHFHRHAFFGLEGELLREWIEPRRRKRNGYDRFNEQYEFKKTVPKIAFEIEDFDGERIKATTLIEQREYTFGEGWFHWLRFFHRNKVCRSLRIEFDKQVGPEKGSWKGGTLGHGIDMLPGELHEAAMRRYCEQEQSSKYRPFKIKFIGPAALSADQPIGEQTK